MKVSVVMTVFNTKESFLKEAIESILNQSFKDFEFLILNDGSTNDIEKVVKSYQDKRIKYFYQENKGLSFSRNKLHDLAKGEYIAIFDSDDISLIERLEKQVKFLDENKDVSILGSWYEAFPKKQIYRPPVIVKYLDLLKGCCMGNPTVMYRKADFEKFNLKYNLNFITAEDYDLWAKAVKYLKIANIQEVLVKYRKQGQNITIKKQAQVQNDDIKVKEKMLEFLTSDKKLQVKIKKLVIEHDKNTFLEDIFSIKNNPRKTHKVITIFGFKIKIKKAKA